MVNAERLRLDEADTGGVPWRRWGPYLSERQWGTVREDYGSGDNTWSYFSHDQARSRAYRWGEDGLAGVSDDRQQLCLALGLWNGRDPILKERLFGLTNAEGNHGEDVKECYFYLDATPTSSYLKMLYKYPQAEFPYADLIAVNAARGKSDPEYELLDTGIFDANRYFDVVIEYAKATPEDLLMQVTVHNRGPEDAELHVLPTLWFRHTWSWAGGAERPSLHVVPGLRGASAVRAEHSALGDRWLYTDQAVPVLVTGNETNNERVFGSANETPHVKDGIDRAVVRGDAAAIDPGGAGTKAALHYKLMVRAGGSATVRLRLTDTEAVQPGRTGTASGLFAGFDELMRTRRGEADEFWADLLAGDLTDDERLVVRQALAGPAVRTEFPQLVQGAAGFLARHPAVTAALWGHGRQAQATGTGPVLFALFDETRLRRILARMLDEEEFLGPHGIRSVSRWHAEHPYVIKVSGQEYRVGYTPAESDTGMFGGNSNWRGPVWFPINVMLIRALLNLHVFYGDSFTVECPTGSGQQLNLYDVAREISDRLTRTFLKDAHGRRPVHGGQPILQSDPHWRDLLLFYEYFHGDNGAGIGASHQTGWTGAAGLLPLLFRGVSAEALRSGGRGAIKRAAAGGRAGAAR